MRKIIIALVSLLFCFCSFIDINAIGEAFPLTEDDIETEIGQYYRQDISIILASEDDDTWINQDSVAFAEDVPDSGFNSDKLELSNEIVESFFSEKPLPTGLEVTGYVIDNPLSIDEDLDGDYYGTLLTVTIEGTVPLDFDVRGYEDDIIELTIPKDYLFYYEVTTPLVQHETYSTGKYKLTCVKYNVTFDTQGHGITPETQRVQSGFKATKPEDLTETGYTFLGWYKEAECINEYDFDTEVIIQDTVIYAKWEEYVPPYNPPAPEPDPTPVFVIPATGIE